MPTAIQISSDWPLALLLKELRLKVLRQIVHQLEARGFWLTEDKCRQIMQARKAHGASLRREILWQALGEIDYSLLDSESLFGIGGYHFATRVPPLMLAFGFDLGNGFHRLLAPGGTQRSHVAKLSALFLFGTSLFDRVCDTLEQDASVFHRVFDGNVLLALVESSLGNVKIAESAALITNAESRILLKVICAFFANLHQSTRVPYESEEWLELATSLIDAYRATVQTSRVPSVELSNSALLAFSAKTWILPFRIVSQLASVCETAHSAKTETVFGAVDRLAHVFWTMDDLVDLTKDLESGNTNSIILKIGDPSLQARPYSIRRIGERLLQGPDIGLTIERLCDDLATVLASLEAAETGSLGEPRFEELILAYLRNWLPKVLSSHSLVGAKFRVPAPSQV